MTTATRLTVASRLRDLLETYRGEWLSIPEILNLLPGNPNPRTVSRTLHRLRQSGFAESRLIEWWERRTFPQERWAPDREHSQILRHNESEWRFVDGHR